MVHVSSMIYIIIHILASLYYISCCNVLALVVHDHLLIIVCRLLYWRRYTYTQSYSLFLAGEFGAIDVLQTLDGVM